MEENNYLSQIIKELAENAKKVNQHELIAFCELICGASRIFIAGAGRSGFAARAFSNRLMHLGFNVFFVGETTTPAINKGDLLIIGSGSGTTGSLVNMAEKAKRIGARIATITIYPNASIGSIADAIVTVPGATPKSEAEDSVKSFQPMGNLFEQLSWIVYDTVVIMIMNRNGITADEMFSRHANLE